ENGNVGTAPSQRRRPLPRPPPTAWTWLADRWRQPAAGAPDRWRRRVGARPYSATVTEQPEPVPRPPIWRTALLVLLCMFASLTSFVFSEVGQTEMALFGFLGILAA